MKRVIAVLTVSVLLVATSFAAADFTTPFAQWKLDGNGNDSGSGGFHLTSGTAGYDAVDHVSGSTSSGVFDNGSNYLGVAPPRINGYDQLGCTYAMGISLWFKWTSDASSSTELRKLFVKWGGTVSTAGRYVQLYTYGDKLGFGLANSSNNAQYYYVDAGLESGKWYHVAVSVDTSAPVTENLKIYLTAEGQQTVASPFVASWAPSDGAGGTNTTIQCYNNGWLTVGDASADSKIDEVRFYRQYALTQSDVQSLYNLEKPVPEPATVVLLTAGAVGMLVRRNK